jgi:hypothetical protein
MPTTCGVTTKKGYPCPNSTTGVLFGCGSARGHTWAKFFARFGIHRNVPRTSRPVHSRSAPGVAEAEVRVEVSGIEEKTKEVITFWLTVVSTFAGVVSMVAGVIAIL